MKRGAAARFVWTQARDETLWTLWGKEKRHRRFDILNALPGKKIASVQAVVDRHRYLLRNRNDLPAPKETLLTPGGFAIVDYYTAKRLAVEAGVCDKRYGLNLVEFNAIRMQRGEVPLAVRGAE